MKVKKSQFIGSIAAFLASLAVLIAAVSVNLAQQNDRLSEAQIEALRAEYPICGNAGLVRASIGTPSLEQMKDRADTFVYGVVEGEMEVYSEYISTGNSALDEKRESVGLGNTYDFYQYTVSVIKDTSGILKKGDKIKLIANMDMIDYNPHLTDGMKIIVPTHLEDDIKKQFSYGVYGTYYVTDDGYAVSAFDENKAQMKRSMSGVRVEKLLEELKK